MNNPGKDPPLRLPHALVKLAQRDQARIAGQRPAREVDDNQRAMAFLRTYL
jgi:hypothetical protein